MKLNKIVYALLAAAAAASGLSESLEGEAVAGVVPTLADAVAQSPQIIRVEVTDVPADGRAVAVEVWEVLFGDFETAGWVDPRYDAPGTDGAPPRTLAFDFKKGAQYLLFCQRGAGGVYKPFFYWNTRWGVADVVGGVDGNVDLSRLAEGNRTIKLAELRELVKEIKWGL